MQINYSCREYTHICMQHRVQLCFCFRQGQLCCKPAAAFCCWLHQSILVRTKVNMRGPAGAVVELVAAKTANLTNQSKPSDRDDATEHQRATPLISWSRGTNIHTSITLVAHIHPLYLSSDAYLKCCQ